MTMFIKNNVYKKHCWKKCCRVAQSFFFHANSDAIINLVVPLTYTTWLLQSDMFSNVI